MSNHVQREILGQIMDGKLDADGFELEDFTGDNRQIFLRMLDLLVRGEPVDRVNVANELMKNDELEKVGGLTYLVELCEP